VIGIYERNFPVIHGSTRSGMKTTIFIREEFIFALLYVLTDIKIAVLGLNPLFIFSYAASMKTITVSIHAPNARIKEKFVRKFSVSPARSRNIKVMKNEIIIHNVDIIDCFNPINNAVIARTNNIEETAFDPKDL
jgi:hypothetical protein